MTTERRHNRFVHVSELTPEIERLRERIAPARGKRPPLDEHGWPIDRRLCPWCDGHKGDYQCQCGGSGLVCPTCRGFRVLRQEDPYDPLERLPQVGCPDCTDFARRKPEERYGKRGEVLFEVDRAAEERAILRYRPATAATVGVGNGRETVG